MLIGKRLSKVSGSENCEGASKFQQVLFGTLFGTFNGALPVRLMVTMGL
jgi:hypothetical protein